MISRISGRIIKRGADFLLVEVGGIGYEVFQPQTVMQRIDDNQDADNQVNLITYYYHQVEPSRSTPVLPESSFDALALRSAPKSPALFRRLLRPSSDHAVAHQCCSNLR